MGSENFHKVVDLTVLSTFVLVSASSERITGFNWYNRVDPTNFTMILIVRMYF